jgi:hypothetical protein
MPAIKIINVNDLNRIKRGKSVHIFADARSDGVFSLNALQSFAA